MGSITPMSMTYHEESKLFPILYLFTIDCLFKKVNTYIYTFYIYIYIDFDLKHSLQFHSIQIVITQLEQIIK